MTSRPEKGSVPDFTFADYGKFFMSGGICATGTHGAVVPIDVVKTRIQIDPELKGMGMVKAGRIVVSQGGPKALLRGFGPTAYGYFLQGGGKFSGYEYFKRKFVNAAGGYEEALPRRTAIYLGSAAAAEFFADILLTPMEATRIRLVSDKNYATGFLSGFLRMAREGGLREFYAGFIPILFKQIPFAIGQFTVNEWAHEMVYNRISEEKRRNLSVIQGGAVTLGCGVVAGISASILSQPADTLLSMINKEKGSGSVLKRLWQLAKQAGPVGLFSGSIPRMIMTAGLVSGQFLVYGQIKNALGAQHGVEIHKDE